MPFPPEVARMWKEILLPLVLGEVPENAIRQAVALASLGQGKVVALVAASLAVPVPAVWAHCPEDGYGSLREAAEATVRELSASAERRLAGEEVVCEIRGSAQFWLTSDEIATLHSRYSDLVVFGAGRPLGEAERLLAGGLIAGSGRPLLLVPATASGAGRFDRIVVAWKSSPEATRALHEAMPLLRRAASVELLVIGDGPGSRTDRSGLDACLEGHLRRHGVFPRWVRRSARHATTGEALLQYLKDTNPDLVVAGAYSHPRALEQVFGGVTNCLLELSPVPVFMSR